MLKRYRQLRLKDLPKVPTWQLEWDLKLRPSGRKAPNLPLCHYAPQPMPHSIVTILFKLKCALELIS